MTDDVVGFVLLALVVAVGPGAWLALAEWFPSGRAVPESAEYTWDLAESLPGVVSELTR